MCHYGEKGEKEMCALNRLFRRDELSSEKEVSKATGRGRRRALDTFAIVGVVVAFLLLSLAQGQVVHAETITVNTIADELNADGDCSLREAIQAANMDTPVDACAGGSGDDTIDVPVGRYILMIPGAGEDANATGDLDITDNLIISGADAATTIIDGNASDRVFHIISDSLLCQGPTVTITDMTIMRGSTTGPFDGGGGIKNDLGSLWITDSIVSENSDFNEGGGILNQDCELTITNSTISGNSARLGGGIFDNGGTLTLTNSTISGNTAERGAGLYEDGNGTIISSTISDNTATELGGGIRVEGDTSLKNTILAGNTAPVGPDCYNDITSLGYNLIFSIIDCTITGDTTGNIIGADPLLGPLLNNGGRTLTHALLPGSPAIDTGSDDCPPPATDQRGFIRPQYEACDIGAFELIERPVAPIDIPAQAGSLEIILLYHSVSPSLFGTIAGFDYFLTEIGSEVAAYSGTIFHRDTILGIDPGEYELVLKYAGSVTQLREDDLVDRVRVNIVPGNTTTTTIDLTGRAGIIKGAVLVNGQSSGYEFFEGGGLSLCVRMPEDQRDGPAVAELCEPVGETGVFRLFLPEGPGRATVCPAGAITVPGPPTGRGERPSATGLGCGQSALAAFDFVVDAGVTTEVGTGN
jgi:CSLREA domain-containing protein